jgi:hypothetical protein
MSNTEIVILVVLILVLLIVAFKPFKRTQARKEVSDTVKQVFPVWAAQGPFESGAESAAAMRRAYLAILGPEKTEEMADAIAVHEAGYDDNPEGWEETRRAAIENSSSDVIELAKGITAAESLNKDIHESVGRRFEFTKLPDGRTDIVNRQIWSDEEIAEQKKEDIDGIVLGIGNGLINDTSTEAQEFVQFLGDIYYQKTQKEPDTKAIGETWLELLSWSDEEPDSELSRKFENLNYARAATSQKAEEEYISQPLHQDFNYWKKRLLPLWPWELEEFLINVNEHKDIVVGEINFQSAVCYCFYEHGFYNRYLNEEEHEKSCVNGEQIVNLIRQTFKDEPDKLFRFEEAHKNALSMAEKFGWPLESHKLDHHEVNQIMSQRVSEEGVPNREN